MKFKTLIIPFLFILICLGSNAAELESYSNLRFNTFSTPEGLSQSSVLSITQDKQGFIWMGTKDGLNKLDGYNFTTFKNEADNPYSLSNNEVIFLTSDSIGNLFVGTRGGGLNKYIKNENKFIRFDDLDTPDGIVTNVFQNSDNSILIGTSQGLFKGTPQNNHRYKFTNLTLKSSFVNNNDEILPFDRSFYSVVCIESLENNKYLIGADKGLYLFDTKKFLFTQIDIGALNQAKVNDLTWDSQNKLWVATSEGMLRIEFENNLPIRIKNFDQDEKWRLINAPWIEKIICDFNGDMWIATRGAGIIRYNEKEQFKQFNNNQELTNSIGDNIINSLLLDQSGILWIGTESNGAVTLDLFRKKFNHFENNTTVGKNLTADLVTAITGNNNEIWVGAAYNGLNYLKRQPDNSIITKHYPTIPVGDGKYSSEIISLLQTKDRTLWIGTASNNLVSFTPKSGFNQIYTGGYAFSLIQDSQNDLWVGTWGNGLALLNKKNEIVQQFNNNPSDTRSLSGNVIINIFEDKQSNLWIGTKGRGVNISPLNQLKQGYNNFTSYEYNDGSGLLHNDVFCIYQDSDNYLWLGTGGGINRINLSHNSTQESKNKFSEIKFESFTIKDGLPSNLVYGLLEDNQSNIWISTSKGLAVFDKQSQSFKSYNSNNGLQGNEFHSNAFYKDINETMYFGGVNGLTFFNPSEIVKDTIPSKIIFSALKVSDKIILPNEEIEGKIILRSDISNTQQITLNHKHKEFSLEFSSTNFTNLENIEYAYRLLGFSNDWRYLKSPEHAVRYTNLFEGEYVFQVKSTNSDGEWNKNVKELKIKVLPPFWRHPWFYAIYLIIFILALFLFRKYTLIGISEKNRLHIEHIERSNLIENTEAKMRFFTNISHEIRTPLTLISNPLEEVISGGSIDQNSKENLKLVSKNVNRLLNLTNQLLQLRKIDKEGLEPQYSETNLVAHVKEITSYFLQKTFNKEITLSFQSEISEESMCWIDTELITTAIYNIISNAYKFTPSKGQINVRVTTRSTSQLGHKKIFKGKTKPEQWFAIEISDTGHGITPEELSNIFIRFYQSKQKQKSELAGSGIGLSIVKEYVELSQGRIEVKSKIDEGTTFTILLPIGNNHVKEGQIRNLPIKSIDSLSKLDGDFETSTPKDEQYSEQPNKPTILIVEDDQELNAYLSQSLSTDYHVVSAFDGIKGAEKAFNTVPSLVISDVMMPHSDGLELCHNLRANEKTKHIPIILLTAKAADEAKIEGYKSGADLYVSKPFKIEVLKSQIEQLLNNRQILEVIFRRNITLGPENKSVSSADEIFLTKMNKLIDDHLAEADFDVASMVEKMHMSHSTVLKKVKTLTGMSLVEFVKVHRLKRAAQILESGKFQISEVAYMVGFNDPKYFSKCFSKEFNQTPTEYVNTIKDKQ